jgi:hypothetical protein
MTLPPECVSLNRPGIEDNNHPRRSARGGGNVGIGFIDFQDYASNRKIQGLWEGRKTAPPLSGLSINRYFHRLILPPSTFKRQSSSLHRLSIARTAPD